MDFLTKILNQRRERQKQGITKAQGLGKYQGRKPDVERYDAINRLLASGSSWSQVQKTLKCSRSTIGSAVKFAEAIQKGKENGASKTKGQ